MCSGLVTWSLETLEQEYAHVLALLDSCKFVLHANHHQRVGLVPWDRGTYLSVNPVWEFAQWQLSQCDGEVIQLL